MGVEKEGPCGRKTREVSTTALTSSRDLSCKLFEALNRVSPFDLTRRLDRRLCFKNNNVLSRRDLEQDNDDNLAVMSSSQPFVTSSPLNPVRRKSKFTFKTLTHLAQSSVNCPLRVIAHIDLDAFYAQCEIVRLDLPESTPLAVQQWSGLIAVSYPARAFGVTRFLDLAEAKKKCPELVCQHVATWKEGEDKWAYREQTNRQIVDEKVSLDPYRLQSRRILATIKDVLPAPPVQRVEKASIDEVFLDLSAQIHGILLERYPELKGPPPYDDPTENLPMPPSTALDWAADALVDLDDAETEDQDPDWDDVVMLIASEIVRDVRKAIRDRLKYTCSAGIARNKMMAKLGSGHKKPNGQTVVRNRAVQHFLSGFKFTKIRNLGGKLGDNVVSTFGTEELTELLKIPVEQLKSKLGDDTGTWLFGVIRGEDHSEVNSRTQIKSMLSAKSFRPSINTFEQAVKWLRIFVADIYARLVEEGVLENKRRPKTMNLHHRQGGHTRSRQIPISQGKKIDENMLLDLAKTLLGQVIVDGRAWPCANLSLSVGGFEDGVTGNRGIGSFLVKGEEAKTMATSTRHESPSIPVDEDSRPEKRRKVAEVPSIQRFFSKNDSAEERDEDEDFDHDVDDATPTANSMPDSHEQAPGTDIQPPEYQHRDIASYFCQNCNKSIPDSEREEHLDWHFAKELQTKDAISSNGVGLHNTARPEIKPSSTKSKRGGLQVARGRGGKPGKGQSRLAFGS